MKILLATSLASALLCAPALADPTPPAANVAIHLQISDGKVVREYSMMLADKSCGGIEGKQRDSADNVKICQTAEGSDAVRLEVDWHTSVGPNESRNRSVIVMRRGQVQQLDGGTSKLDVKASWPGA
jgi:hypothetical protein